MSKTLLGPIALNLGVAFGGALLLVSWLTGVGAATSPRYELRGADASGAEWTLPVTGDCRSAIRAQALPSGVRAVECVPVVR